MPPPLTSGRRVAVITGGSSGIGAALARALAERGWLCVLLARTEDRLFRVAEEVGGEAHVCDVGDREAVEAVARGVLDRHPAVSLLVNNAGVAGRASFLDAEPERIEGVLRTNYLGSVWPTRAFLPGLEAAGRADLVNVVSVAGSVAVPASGPYAASKHAQLAFSRSIAEPLRRRGIRVHTVSPGFVETEGFPQRVLIRSPLVYRVVVKPDAIAAHLLDVLDRDRRDTFVPGWYRAVALAHALAPATVGRLLAAASRR